MIEDGLASPIGPLVNVSPAKRPSRTTLQGKLVTLVPLDPVAHGDALYEATHGAAVRFGFTLEGIFRQHMIVKGRNRDTAWFSMLDSEWPARKASFERWLDPSNFGPDGRQKVA